MRDDAPNPLLNIGWGAVTAVALLSGSVLLGAWLAATAGLAAAQIARGWKRHASPPLPYAAAAAAAAGVLGAGFGLPGLVVMAALGGAGAAAWASAEGRNPALTLWCAAIPCVAAAAPVVLRATDGLVPALVLLTYAAVYDAADAVMGAGARFAFEGPIAGVASIASVTLAVAAVFPQFKGAEPWELGALACVLVVSGPVLAQRVLVRGQARVPALLRLDSLLLLGPVWAVAAKMVLS